MNKWITLILVLLIGTTSCVDEIDLRPFELPSLTKSTVRRVEAFELDSALFVATDEGVMLLYGDEQILFDAGSYDELLEIEWTNAEVLYAPTTDIFWVIADSAFLRVGRNTFDLHYDRTNFYAPTKSYFDYALSPDGKLYRLGYYDEVWDPNSGSFFSDYMIGIYEFVGNPNNTWKETQTDLGVNSKFLADPTFVFAENGDLIINTNPVYVVTSFNQSEVVADSISKTGSGFKFRTSYQPYLSETGHMYGLFSEPTFLTPVVAVVDHALNEEEVRLHALDENCEMPSSSQGAVKLLDWQSDQARFFVQVFSSPQTGESEELGYIMTFDLASDQCSLRSLRSHPDLKWSEGINDLDILEDKVYIGTREELMVYDLNTDDVTSYLFNAIENLSVQ